MTKVTVCIDLDKDRYEVFARQARRKGVTLETLLREAVQELFIEHDEHLREEEESHEIQF